jgi:HAD superfamily hydrolase (TIGR01509 family)
VRAVIFDLGGVVFDYRPELRWQTFAEETGETPEAVRKRLSDSGYAQACELGRLKGSKAYNEGTRMLGKRLSRERFTQIWVSVFRPNEAVIELAGDLKNRCAVSLLTNNSDLVRAGLESAYPHVMELFRPRLFSSDLGFMKPDPRTFAAMLELLGVDADEALLIDDALINTSTAESLGMATHSFKDASALRIALEQSALL